MEIRSVLSKQILDQARAFGASLAGFVPLSALQESTAHLTRRDHISAERGSLLVMALEHPESEPELDWWGGEGGTEGNRRLIAVAMQLQQLLAAEPEIKARPLPYHPWKGGVLLKDAAALAGLGCIGDNNLLITPQYGTRVRLRAMLVDLDLAPLDVSEFAPCAACLHPCWQACPQQAFAAGAYDKGRCTRQMELDEATPVRYPNNGSHDSLVSFCRACELACPVARSPGS